ncbi:adhesion G protein-coupled receptor G3 [Apteryx mantelli]|uniref:Adhesion G protein-coupled receptor G3 n=1 Tax=Apteryx mantelli TaxID=2696672 RepID=A0ABM4F1V9_9AVES
MRTLPLTQEKPQALGEPPKERGRGRGSRELPARVPGCQETRRSSMKHLLLSSVLLLLLLPDAVRGQKSCDALKRGDNSYNCCNTTVNPEEEGRVNGNLSAECKELWQASNLACRCLREKTYRFLQSASFSGGEKIAGLKALLVNISRAILHDVVFSFSPSEGPKRINSTDKGNTSKIQLPRELFQSMRNRTAQVVVMVLNIKQLFIFKETSWTQHILDNTVVGITVRDTRVTGLRDPVRLTFTHGQLPRSMSPQCVFWDPSKGQGGDWDTSGCVTQHRDKRTVCSCDHLTFFTLLLSPTLDRSTAQTLMVIANVGCGVAVAFSVFSIVFYIFLRCTYKKFKSDETIQINMALHMNLISSLFLLNLTFLFNNWISITRQPELCKGLGGFTHYCLLCCFTWMALEGCHLYLLFVKVLGTYIRHYLVKLCIVGWGFPALVVIVAGSIGSYGKYNLQNVDDQPIMSLCFIKYEHVMVHYITNCGYFGLIFLFNTVIFGVVAWKNYHLQSTRAVKENRKAWKVGLMAVGLFCLLGATWALAFLTYGNAFVPLRYLFAILNSLQGLFIFIWLVVLYSPKKEETTGSSSHIIRNDKTTTVSQD